MAKSKYTMREIIDARQTIGSAYDQAKQLKDPDDKLIILKMGYYYATQEVPDPTKRTEYWHLLDIDKYQKTLLNKYIKNRDQAHPNKQLDTVLRRRLDDVNIFNEDVVKHENRRNFADFLLIVNKDYRPVYPNAAQFGVYIQPYQEFLQKKFAKSKQNINIERPQ